MSDNVGIKDASGNTKAIAADDDGTALHQRVLVEFGPDGSPVQVTTGTPLPVAVMSSVATSVSVTASVPLSVSSTRSSTPTQSSVAGSATNVTLLASNANRLGATFYNDSTANLYLKLGATASTSSFTILLLGGDYYEVPFSYTGQIDGLWASATGNARITELT
jgi:hypothetical protein